MPEVDFTRGLDVFAFLDADSDEARTFTTYLGYWDGLARLIEDHYGPSTHTAIVTEVLRQKPVRKLQAKKFSGDESELAAVLLNGWAQEAGLYAVDDDDPRLMLQNLWNNVQAYYATSAALRAFLLVYTGNVPQTHARTLRAAAGLVNDTPLLPFPWNVTCTSHATPTFTGFGGPPSDCSNLGSTVPAPDIVAKALKTTRRRIIDEKVGQFKIDKKINRAPNGLRQRLDSDERATGVFDFMWRSRTRANYGDPSMFYMGSLDQFRSSHYINSVRTVTAATMLVFETMLAQRAPQTLLDTAVHFISRDRSKISDDVLGRRLRAIGLLAPETPADHEPF